MSRHRRTGAAAAVAALLSAAVLAAAAAASPASMRTVNVHVRFSRFDLPSLAVTPGETVRLVVTNDDPIDHEFIVGDATVQRVHENGTEPAHGARPGEISLPAGATVETTYTFPAELDRGWEFACHLPGHYAYGMHGPITIG